MKRKDKKHILIAVPCESSTVHIPVATFACEALRQNSRRGCPYRFSVAFLDSRKPTEYARNILTTLAIDKKSVDAIWFVDEDMSPTWPDSFQLLDVDADIIAGIAPINNGKDLEVPSFTWNLYREVKDQDSPDDTSFFPISPNGNKEMPVDGVGTACMIIKRHVLVDRRLWLGERTKEGTIPLFRWPRDIAGATLGTDDLDFCKRARALGYTIKAVPSIRWGHIKEMDLQWVMKKMQTMTSRPPQLLLTINDLNEYQVRQGHTPTFIHQYSPPKPSSEAAPESPGEALIVPTAVN